MGQRVAQMRRQLFAISPSTAPKLTSTFSDVGSTRRSTVVVDTFNVAPNTSNASWGAASAAFLHATYVPLLAPAKSTTMFIVASPFTYTEVLSFTGVAVLAARAAAAAASLPGHTLANSSVSPVATSPLATGPRVRPMVLSPVTYSLSAATADTITATPRCLKGPAPPPVDRHRYRRSGDAMPEKSQERVADPAETVTA